jgi:hypothetical protein
MNKFFKFLNSFYKNVILKRKFKSFFMILTDKEFRAQLNHLHFLTKDCVNQRLEDIDSDQIVYGHKIVYPEYEEYLCQQHPLSLQPIRVVLDSSVDKYRVVDGNHRLKAWKQGYNKIICKVMS